MHVCNTDLQYGSLDGCREMEGVSTNTAHDENDINHLLVLVGSQPLSTGC